MKRCTFHAVVLLALVALSGCATMTPDFAAKPEFWEQKNHVVGVAVAELPQPAALKAGSQGLLDVAINNAMAGSMEEYLTTLDITRVNETADYVADYLREQGFQVRRIKEPLNIESLKELEDKGGNDGYFAERDFAALKNELDVGKLLLISVNQIGTMRSYYGFIPLSDPVGYCNVSGQVINLENNQLEWNQTVTQSTPVSDGEWNAPPDYPALTAAVFRAYDQSRTVLVNNFVQ